MGVCPVRSQVFNLSRWQIAEDIFDTLDRLNEIGECLENCLERFKYHTIGVEVSGPVRGLLVKFYAHILQFAITASQTYSRSKSSTTYSFYVRRDAKTPQKPLFTCFANLSKFHLTNSLQGCNTYPKRYTRLIRQKVSMKSKNVGSTSKLSQANDLIMFTYSPASQ
jgi:hypothetical protein